MSELRINNITNKTGDNGPIVAGISSVSSSGFMVMPSGDTAIRGVGSGRGVIASGGYPANLKTCDLIQIPTTGNATDFGSLADGGYGRGSFSSSTRGVVVGGGGPNYGAAGEYVTISSNGGGNDFGDLDLGRRFFSHGASDNTVGMVMGGHASPSLGTAAQRARREIDFIIIASTGDFSDFGELIRGRSDNACCSSPTRGFTAGDQGYAPAYNETNTIEFVTIQTKGNAILFGDLTREHYGMGSCSSTTRGIWAGGGAPLSNIIDFITMASTGNAQDFGDLTSGSYSQLRGLSNSIRGCFAGGYISPAETNIIHFVTIASTGDSTDFGDLTDGRYGPAPFSDSHGSLG